MASELEKRALKKNDGVLANAGQFAAVIGPFVSILFIGIIPDAVLPILAKRRKPE